LKKIVILPVALILLIILISLATAAGNPFVKPFPPKNQSAGETQLSVPKPTAPVLPKLPVTPSRVHGVYSTSWIAGSKRIDEIIGFIKRAKLNALVIDLKDDTGTISFQSNIALAKEIGANSNRIHNLKALVDKLKEEKIYTIARIVVFKDPLLARKHPEIAVKDVNGGLWKDRKGMIWVDPNCRQVWKYNLDLAKEAVSIGFSEIQFDYVRFLSDGKISNTIYPFSKGERKEDVIRNFLLYAKKDLNAMGVPLSADIFGLVLSVPDDLNIGQKLEKIIGAVDVISPMVYPSHYPKGSFKFANPDLHPYEVVYNALSDGVRRIQSQNSKVKIRPWLQDFDLGNYYGREQLQDQIKALEANGIHDWLFWNPRNRYDESKYPAE
jgi:hypothetical protein